MECLTWSVSIDIFMGNYFISCRLLTHLGINNIRATHVLNKNRFPKCTIIGDKQLQKKEIDLSKQRTSSKKSSVTLTMVGWNDNSAIYIASFESCERKRFVWRWNKVEKIYSRTSAKSAPKRKQTVLSKEWTRMWPSIVIQKKCEFALFYYIFFKKIKNDITHQKITKQLLKMFLINQKYFV